jgi:hypothetical protein
MTTEWAFMARWHSVGLTMSSGNDEAAPGCAAAETVGKDSRYTSSLTDSRSSTHG